MRPSYLERVDVPKLYDHIDMKLYKYKKEYKNRNNNEKDGYYFSYDVFYPSGVVFSNRKCHFRFHVLCQKYGLFCQNVNQISMYIIAYPSAQDKRDGYCYTATIGFRHIGCDCSIEAMLSRGEKLREFLQKFINSDRISGRDYESKWSEHYDYKEKIYININWEDAENGHVDYYELKDK